MMQAVAARRLFELGMKLRHWRNSRRLPEIDHMALDDDRRTRLGHRRTLRLSAPTHGLEPTLSGDAGICDRLNAVGRKCLGYRTPAEVFWQKPLAAARGMRDDGMAAASARTSTSSTVPTRWLRASSLGVRPDPVPQNFGKANVTWLVGRVGRVAVLLRNNDRQSRRSLEGLIQVLQSLPHPARRSITFGCGTEFTDWIYLQAGIGAQTWFCDPQSPWQKGTAENANGRARKWLSREVDPLSITNHDLRDICDRLNRANASNTRQDASRGIPAELLAQMRRAG